MGLTLAPLTASASSHREAPLIAEDPLADNTDLYTFQAPDNPNNVVLVANYVPFENPAGGPNFYRFGDDVRYQIHVDNVGDGKSHVTFTFRFRTSTVDGTTFLYNTPYVRDGALTFGRTTRDFFTKGPDAAKRTWKGNAANTKTNAKAGGRAVRSAAKGG